MSKRKSRPVDWQTQGSEVGPGPSASPMFDSVSAEEAVKETEALIRSLIVEERRRITPSLFPELEPADEEEFAEDGDETELSGRQTLNQSVREILRAERIAGSAYDEEARRGVFSRALSAFRRKRAERDDLDHSF